MTLTEARKTGCGHPSAAIVAAHNALIEKYVGDRRHLEKGEVKSYRRIVRDPGFIMSRDTVKRTMRRLHPKIAREITERHTTPKGGRMPDLVRVLAA